MKKIRCVLAVVIVFITSCKKNNNACGYTQYNTVAPAAEIDSLHHLIFDTLHKTATPDVSGIFYAITDSGSGAGITSLCSSITVAYKGSLFDSTIFDSTATGTFATFQLGQTILGWRKGIPLLKTGGDITLYVPPTLGYGSVAQVDANNVVIIPANSYLQFQIHISDIQ